MNERSDETLPEHRIAPDRFHEMFKWVKPFQDRTEQKSFLVEEICGIVLNLIFYFKIF